MKKTIITLVIVISLVSGHSIYRVLTKPISPYIHYANLIPHTYRLGFTNLETEVTALPLSIQGTLPTWLTGTLYRNGSAQFSTSTSWVNWFDGLAMIHAFMITHGAISYTNKFLKTDDYHSVQKTGAMTYAGFAQDPCSSIFKTIANWFTPQVAFDLPNANVNIARYTDHLVALTEVPLPIEFDPKTLATIGGFIYNDHLPKRRIHDTAHPHYDPITHEHLGYFTQFGRTSTVNIYSIADNSKERRIIASYQTTEPSYMHSFGITEHYAILPALPLVVNLFDLLLRNKAFIKNFRWKPERGTRFMVFNRHTGTFVGSFTGEPFFAFHVVNAYEQENLIFIDIITYQDAYVIEQATMAKILSPQPEQTATSGLLKRFTIDLSSPTVTSKILYPTDIELPRINYDYNGKEYTFVYAFAQIGQKHPFTPDALVKIKVKTGDSLLWQENNCFPSEPVFVARPGATTEDDGIVMSVILDATRNTSFLLILDGHTFTELARACLPHHIPFNIHGQFFGST